MIRTRVELDIDKRSYLYDLLCNIALQIYGTLPFEHPPTYVVRNRASIEESITPEMTHIAMHPQTYRIWRNSSPVGLLHEGLNSEYRVATYHHTVVRYTRILISGAIPVDTILGPQNEERGL